jgi:hypothetical protein
VTVEFAVKGRLGLSVRALAAIAVAFGLWVSWRYAVSTWGGDGDTSVPAVLWHGWRQHGLAFITSFRFTPDNWLIWPMPLFFAAFAVFGDTPEVIVAVGWLICVGCAAMAGLVVRRLAGWGAGAAVAIVLLLANRSAVSFGLYSYPLTHNASLLAGLFALYGGVRWLEARSWPWLAAMVVALAAAGASDPWTQAALTAPIALGGAWLAWRDRAEAPLPGLALAAAAGLAFLAAQLRLFGLLSFVPGQPLLIAHEGVGPRALQIGRSLALWLNLLPGRDAPTGNTAPVVVNLLILAVALSFAFTLVRRRLAEAPGLALLWVAGSLSFAITAAAFVLLPFEAAPELSRYFMADYAFAVMLYAAAVGPVWRALNRMGRVLVVLPAFALAVSGLVSGWPLWTQASPPPRGSAALDLAKALEAQGLTYGYGQYWDAWANPLTWLTHGVVTIRPVGFDPASGRVQPRGAESSPLWYQAGDRPPGARSSFLMIGSWNAADSDGCKVRASCIAAARLQFGPPVRQFTYGGSDVLVWDHPLFGASLADRAAAVSMIPFGQTLDLKAGGDGTYLLGDGWSVSEPPGTWSVANQANLLIHAPADAGAVRLTFLAGSFAPPPMPGQVVTVTVDGRAVARLLVAPGEPRPYAVTIPKALISGGAAVVGFDMPGAISPQAAHVSADVRKLGIMLSGLRLDPAA